MINRYKIPGHLALKTCEKYQLVRTHRKTAVPAH